MSQQPEATETETEVQTPDPGDAYELGYKAGRSDKDDQFTRRLKLRSMRLRERMTDSEIRAGELNAITAALQGLGDYNGGDEDAHTRAELGRTIAHYAKRFRGDA